VVVNPCKRFSLIPKLVPVLVGLVCASLPISGQAVASTNPKFAPIKRPSNEPSLCEQAPKKGQASIRSSKLGITTVLEPTSSPQKSTAVSIFETFYGGCYDYYRLGPKPYTVSIYFDTSDRDVAKQEYYVDTYLVASDAFKSVSFQRLVKG